MKDIRDFRFFWTFIKPHQLLFVTGLISVVAVVLCILQMGQSLRALIQSSDLSAFLPSLWSLAFWVCILAIASFGRSYSFAYLAEKVANDLKQILFSNLMRLEMSFYDQQGTNEILARFHKDTEAIQQFLSGTLGTAVRNLLMFVGGMVLLLQTSWSLTIVALATLPFILVPVIGCLRFYRRHSQRTLAAQDLEAGYVAESIHNIRLVQAFSYGSHALAHWLELLTEAEHSAQRRYRARAWVSSLIIMLISLSIAGVLTAGVYSVHAGHMAPGQLAAFLFYAVVVAATASSLMEMLGDWQRALISKQHLEPLLEATPQRLPVYQHLPAQVAGIIAVHHINFAYPHQSSQRVLNDVTLSAATGEMVAIVGPSGAGKSTLLSLLLGFYQPQAGQIFLDGVDQAKVDPDVWRSHFGYVSQEPFIFSDTLYNNILMGNMQACELEVQRAVEAASLGEFVAQLPYGLATRLGNGGIALSAGQKQRLSVARVILRNPRVLLLDEATNALDALSEAHVQESLRNLMATRTTLVVAHRLKTVLRANRIIVLNEGRVEEIGTHAELIGQPGLYQRLATVEFIDVNLQGAAVRRTHSTPTI